MRLDLLDYELPEAAIAQRPSQARGGARLLCVEADGLHHRRFDEWAQLVPAGALVVLNDTRVRRSRLWCKKATGGNVEVLLLETRPAADGRELWTVLARANRPLRVGQRLELGEASFTVQRQLEAGEVELLAEGHGELESFLERYGHVPLPPYIRRADDPDDASRYQTVFAQHLGSAAAPTAGLHLTEETMATLRGRGVTIGFATLHVGAGTFLPVRCEDLDDHPMHSEAYVISEALAAQVAAARARGAPIVAVGTTVVRALESAHDTKRPGHVRACAELTRLLIQPGYRFNVVDALLTNFHAPRSTLLALVSAFIGARRRAEAYSAALAAGYRFLSYGDAMWLPRRIGVDLPEGAGELRWRA